LKKYGVEGKAHTLLELSIIKIMANKAERTLIILKVLYRYFSN
jgi:hypothetical protein